MGIGTFGSFTQARLAIYAATAGITVSGNNISNVNTVGYTRQKLDQSSMYLGGTDRYYSANDVRIGAGVMCDGVSQMRDPYLDIRYRNENSAVGTKDGWLAGLEGVQQILDEVGDGEIAEGREFGIVGAYLSKIYQALNDLTDQTGQAQYDREVRAACENLAHALNSYGARLTQLYGETEMLFEQQVATVNTLLTDIRNLNENIRTAEIYGDNALELRDERNNKLDELSAYMKIDVTYTTEHIGAGQEIEKMVLRLGNANPTANVSTDETVLIDGIYGAQISILPKMNVDAAGVADPDKPYLDAQDQPTDDITRAAHNDNFNLQISELRNSRSQILSYTTQSRAVKLDGADPADAAVIAGLTAGTQDNPVVNDILDDGGRKIGQTTTTYYEKGGDFYFLTVTQKKSMPVNLDDNDISGKLQSYRELLTEAGEFTPEDVINGNVGLSSDENAASKRGLKYYINCLDLFANQLAASFNNVNQGYLTDPDGNFITRDYKDGKLAGVPLTVNINGVDFSPTADMLKAGVEWNLDPASGGVPQNVQDAIKAQTYETTDKDGNTVNVTYVLRDADGNPIKDADGNEIPDINRYLQNVTRTITGPDGDVEVPLAEFRGGPLFSSHGDSDDATGITASNISISASWSVGAMIVPSFICPPGDCEPASTDSSNILKNMTRIEYNKIDFVPGDIDPDSPDHVMFRGTLRDMWINMGTVLGNDMTVTGTELDTHYATALEIDTSRDSISGVNFNDEAMNLMMYSKAYNAACRLMTALDSVLDKLINGTGVTT